MTLLAIQNRLIYPIRHPTKPYFRSKATTHSGAYASATPPCVAAPVENEPLFTG